MARAEENIRPSLGWLGEVFSRPEMLRLSPDMLPIVTVGDKKCFIRIVWLKLLPTVTVGDKKCFIRIVWLKLLPTVTVGDKMWVIRIVWLKLLMTVTVGSNIRVMCSMRLLHL